MPDSHDGPTIQLDEASAELTERWLAGINAGINAAADATPAWEAQRAPGPWAKVEIMGHRVVAGSLSDAHHAGAPFLQVQHPSMPNHDGTGPLTELFGPTAIFSIRPCSREEASRCAEARWRHPPRPAPSVAELESAVDADVIEDDHQDYYDEDDF